jgi:hypothetical protein
VGWHLLGRPARLPPADSHGLRRPVPRRVRRPENCRSARRLAAVCLAARLTLRGTFGSVSESGREMRTPTAMRLVARSPQAAEFLSAASGCRAPHQCATTRPSDRPRGAALSRMAWPRPPGRPPARAAAWHVARRMSSQHSCFTIHGRDESALDKLHQGENGCLVKIVVPATKTD